MAWRASEMRRWARQVPDVEERPLLCTKSRWWVSHSMPPRWRASMSSLVALAPGKGNSGSLGSV
eukprot:2215691-Lingulodinium_polyedra.AAC.1